MWKCNKKVRLSPLVTQRVCVISSTWYLLCTSLFTPFGVGNEQAQKRRRASERVKNPPPCEPNYKQTENHVRAVNIRNTKENDILFHCDLKFNWDMFYSLLQARPSASSQSSAEEVRALLERIRASQNANYYDNSLLQNSGDSAGRNVAPNEYNHVNNGSPDNPLTLGANSQQNNYPGNSPQDNSGGYLANSPGVAQNWQGGGLSSSNNNNNDDTQAHPSFAQLFPDRGFEIDTRSNSSRTPENDVKKCDLIGPNVCPLPPEFTNTETRTEEEIKKDLWQPDGVSRYGGGWSGRDGRSLDPPMCSKYWN